MRRSLPVLSLLASIAALMLLAQGAYAAVRCTELATNPADGLLGAPGVKSVNSQIIAASGSNVSYCQVNILYGTNANQNINIRVGLPLNTIDGGTGGAQGAWNGRTQATGGGGCAGSLAVNGAVNAGYVGSGTDTGHSGGNCEPGVNTDGTYNLQFINDFIRNGIEQQVLFAKAVAKTYYEQKPAYNYWNGCSTGGRQGYLIAQELGNELDGILANAPAMYWTRFQTAQMWGQILMNDAFGAVIPAAKLNQATASAVAACDAADGVVDGIIDDPRTCHFSAHANVCGEPTAPATNCLSLQEADVIDQIWDGPRNAEGDKIWFGLDRGTSLPALNGATPFALGVTQFHWDEHDRSFDWKGVSAYPSSKTKYYAQVAQDGSRNIADVTDTFGNLDTFKAHGGKLLTLVGANDQLIMPRGVINYYRQMATRYSNHDKPDFKRLQDFYRLFRVPAAGHCQVPNAFPALVAWVEQGVAPAQIPTQITNASGTHPRPLCPYPQTDIYSGSGSTDDAANFYCGGNLEKLHTVCEDAIATYKSEVAGPTDYTGMGVNPVACQNATR